MGTHLEFLSALRTRLPNNRRRVDFYQKLDVLLPAWPSIVIDPEFATWMMRIDSASGACMFNRLNALWSDPLYGPEDFAVLLRIFVREKDNRKELGNTNIRQGENRKATGRSANSMALPVLSRKYEILSLLGRGGNGEVYLVWSTETESLYALKTIREDLTTDPVVRESFRKEANAWIRIGEHPNVTKAFFFEELGSRLYITMAFIEGDDDGTGPSLADKLLGGPIDVKNLCVWFCQLADGLAHAYASGIRAHRDIKPANILLGRDGIARVSDFGLAVTPQLRIERDKSDCVVEGTPLFMPPEQFANSLDCDERSDLYSIGVTLYQAVSGGTLPFSPRFTPRTNQELHRYFSEVRNLHERARPTPLASPLWPVIERCLEKHPTKRFTGIKEFRVALEAVAQKQGLSSPKPAKATGDFWQLRDQGNSFMRLGKYQDAIKAFDAFLSVLPDDSAVFNRAVCLENLGHHADALTVYQRYAERNDVKGLVNGSNCLLRLGRKDEALSYAMRAVEADAGDIQCWIAMGNAAFGLGKYEDAMRSYCAAHKLDLTAPTPAYNYGLAAERIGAMDAAKQAYAAFIQCSHPDDSRRQYVAKAFKRISEKTNSQD